MYMDGFHSALFHNTNSNSNNQTPLLPCLNLLHPSWTLDTPTKFIVAMIVVSLIGMLVEACGVWRVRCLRKGRKVKQVRAMELKRRWDEAQRIVQRQQQQQQQQQFMNDPEHIGIDGSMQGQQLECPSDSVISDVSSEAISTQQPASNSATHVIICPAILRRIWRTIVPRCIRSFCTKLVRFSAGGATNKENNSKQLAKRYDIAAATLHATRAALGYILMLAVMTYAIEFLVSAVVGMCCGRYWFVDGGDSFVGGGGIGGNGVGGGVVNGAVGVGGNIGGMGLGDAGGGGVGMSDSMFQNEQDSYRNDGTWGGGGDPCCGLDDHDDEVEHEQQHHDGDDLREPLLSSLIGSNSNNVGVTRRGLQIE